MAQNSLGQEIDETPPAGTVAGDAFSSDPYQPAGSGSFDLGTNSQVPLAAGNAAQADGTPADLTGVLPVWSEETGTLTLNDQGDGTVVAVRVSADAGSAIVTATITNADGSTATASLSISLSAQGVVPSGGIASFDIVPGIAS